MKVVLLAGGLGTRLSEETDMRPKPMVEIGDRPILWHIMKIYAHYCFNDFHIALGYKGEAIKRYFWELNNLSGNLTIQFGSGNVERLCEEIEDWQVHLIDTGLDTQTGGRLQRLKPYLCDATFMLTYGDGVSNVDLADLLRFHRAQGCISTVTAVRPPARFGGLILEGGRAAGFSEKPQIGEGWINGGFFVFEPRIFDYLDGDATNLEADVLTRLAADGQLAAYQHTGFWQCMDTLREKRLLDHLWKEGNKPWKVWKD
ncbi:MAG TPA: glucose-1-phosphate cytidylyltransferase [Anaerolineaceae bacterium]|nr:glucose-1-phosphate cytidylyltransferase [Anaerolineaceae bacterium]